MKIGLLGGSFNPAHEGHIAVSLEAIRRLGLDEVWWLVSPQNPLKSKAGLASVKQRVEIAESVIKHPKIKVKDIESRIGTTYTIETLEWITVHYRDHKFIWLMGADNLAIFHKWRRWKDIFRLVPIAIFDRLPYTQAALFGKAAESFSKCRKNNYRTLVTCSAPCWSYISIKPHPASSTEIRENDKKHNRL
jgi:nicotinate-nucleotide adenylyltransferase